MNYAVILAAGVGQRMRNGGMPKQFLKLMGKPVIIYTLERFEQCEEIDGIVIVSHGAYTEHMEELVKRYDISKVRRIVVGGTDRQGSLERGLRAVGECGAADDDIVLIHDGVRPLVSDQTLMENIRVAKEYGCAITVHPVTESVLVTGDENADFDDFMKREDSYSMTSPQTFRLGEIMEAYSEIYGSAASEGSRSSSAADSEMPLLDAGMVYASLGNSIHIVKEHNANIKITTPEDYYFLKAILELEESKYVFGL